MVARARSGAVETPPPLEAVGLTRALAPVARGWRLGLLGGFRLQHDGIDVAVPLSAQRLLAFLAIHSDAHQRAFVAGGLWTDFSGHHANASLRTTLWRLRTLDCELIVSSKNELALHSTLAVDLHEARRCAQDVIRHIGPADVAVHVLLDHGELLPDWYEDWVLVEREHYRQVRLHALEKLCDELVLRGAYAAAVDAALACVAADPLRESAHRAVIKVHLAEGNLSDAIRQFRFYEALVHERLGLQPSTEIRLMIERCFPATVV